MYSGKEARRSDGKNLPSTLLTNCYVIIRLNVILYTSMIHLLNWRNIFLPIRLIYSWNYQKVVQRISRINTIRLGQGENIKLANGDGIGVCRWVDKRDVYSLPTITAGDDVDVPVIQYDK